MGLYNFQERFVQPMLSGRKNHTIRAIRAHPDKPGNTLHLYTGLRTKHAKLLMRVPCVKIEEIEITESRLARGVVASTRISVKIDGVELDRGEKNALAYRDGFNSFEDMMHFWKGRLPFHGHVIHWRRD